MRILSVLAISAIMVTVSSVAMVWWTQARGNVEFARFTWSEGTIVLDTWVLGLLFSVIGIVLSGAVIVNLLGRAPKRIE